MKIFCAGIARNCGRTLAQTVGLINAALPPNWEREWLIVESDSDDNTAQVLEEIKARDSNFSFSIEGKLLNRFDLFTDRLAYCRNIYLEAALHSGSDFLLIADLDGIVTKVPANLISELLKEESDWTGLFASQSGPYYDLAALRHKDWNPSNPFRYRDFLISIGYSERLASKKAIVEKMLRIPVDAARIPVDSAFGGLAIYRLSDFSPETKYTGNLDGVGICEHVPLNFLLVGSGKKLYIEPRLQVSRYTEHTYQLSKSNRLAAAIMKVLFLPLGEKRFKRIIELLASLYKRFK